MTILSVSPTEEGIYVITVAFTDEDEAAVTPSAATWTLSDEAGNVINSRADVAIGSLSTSVEIVLAGADLSLATYPDPLRVFTVTYTYSSSLGELTTHSEVSFYITPAVNVP